MPHVAPQEPDLRPYCGSPLADHKAHAWRLLTRTPSSDAYCRFCPAERRFDPKPMQYVGRSSPDERRQRAELAQALREAEAL